jgi:4-amino-4-deoxy-L-arabinose transferase-like glycosyltransferase
MLNNIVRSLRQHTAVWAIAAAATALHLAYAGRYDIFRNELYYIVCGRHPAFGYADQPPLVPLVAAGTQMFGLSAWLLRLPGALAAGALVKLTADFALLLGGGRAAPIIAAAASAMAPALIGMAQLTTTSTFEPLAWTAFAYFVTSAIVQPERPRALLWAGVVAGLALEAKYGLLLWIAGLVLGVAATPARRLLLTRQAAQGAFIGFSIAAPSLIWQALNGWPFLAVMLHHTAGHTNFTGTPLRYEIGQALAMNALLAPLWLAGVISPFATQRLKAARPLAIDYVVTAALIILLRGKDYYLFPAYPTLFAVGAVPAGMLTTWLLTPWMLVAAANSALLLPIVLPILAPPRLAAFFDRHPHLHPAPDELAGVGAPLTQVFSDELGWRALEQSVAAVYRKLPPEDQRRAAIVASNYGEAAAIDVYGRADNLPPAISGQNQYYFWGPRGYDGSVVIHINGSPDRWRTFCASIEMAGTFGAPLVMPYENDRPIFICRGLKVPFAEAWEMFKRFQ